MNLISTLNSGIAAAANGWAEVYIRGTSTRATVYFDFEASTSDSSGDNIDLDAYGAVEVYVNQLVDVVAKSPDGTIIRSWTDGYSSPNVEVISPAFTGADYVSGAIAVNEPTTLQSVLDRWLDSAGAPDWEVDIGGTDTPLDEAFGSLTGLVFNVKSPAYGAVGDGVVNDQSAIQAALADAVAAGGGTVFFPKGTYLISTAIEWSHLVNILGVGAGQSVLTTNSGINARHITWTSGSAQSQPLTIQGMAFSATQVNTGSQLYCNVAVNLLVQNCWFGASTNCTGILTNIAGANSKATFRNCRWNVGSASYAATTANTAYAAYQRCFFATTGTSGPSDMLRVQGASDVVHACVFDFTSVTAPGSQVAIQQANTGGLSVVGCSFVPLAQTFTTCIGLVGGFVNVSDNDFSFQTPSTWYTLGANLTVGSYLQPSSSSSSNTTAATIPLGSEFHAHSSNTTAPTFTVPRGPYVGFRMAMTLFNASGGNWASIGFAGFTVAPVSSLVGSISVNSINSIAMILHWTGSEWLICHKD